MLLLAQLSGCGFFQRTELPPITTPRAEARPSVPRTPTEESLSKYGNPSFYDVLGKRYFPLKSAANYRERGIASWYGPDFHGGLTSTRESYDMYQMSAAHKVLPLPTWVEVTNLENGRKAIVRINDRGPFKDNRIIDLSYAAALKLDIVKAGTAFVEVRAVSSPSAPAPAAPVGASPLEPSASPQMYVQIGAFGERTNAERLKARIDPEFNGEIQIIAEPELTPQLYKVQLGPLRDVAAADQAVSTLEALGISEHHFVNH